MALAVAESMATENEAGERRGSDSFPSVKPHGPSLPPHFLSRLAHDIRSPLGLLSGAIEEIREDLEGQLSEGHQRMLSLAQRGLARLERMARTLSTVAQLEAGEIELGRVTTDVVPMLRKALEAVEAEDPRRGLTSETIAPSSCSLSLDPERAHEALWELLGQSRRQAKSLVRVTLTEHADRIEIAIEDDGRGFSPEQRRFAFDRLYEPDDRRGTGFGLSIARDLVRAHGGDVTLDESTLPAGRPGTVGCRFVVTFKR